MPEQRLQVGLGREVQPLVQRTDPIANSDDPGHFIAAAEQRMAGNQLEDSAARLAMTGKTTVSEAMRVTAQLED